MDVEGGEIGKVEPHRGAAIFERPGKFGAGPVEHRHEIVADRRDAGPGQVFQAALVVDEIGAPIARLRLDRLRNRQALHHVPGEPGHAAVGVKRHVALARLDLLGVPDRPGRNVVQRRHHARRSRLARIRQRNLVLWTKPAPRLTHAPASLFLVH
jgi:hypothetical protein